MFNSFMAMFRFLSYEQARNSFSWCMSCRINVNKFKNNMQYNAHMDL